jgi:hypothetical protein
VPAAACGSAEGPQERPERELTRTAARVNASVLGTSGTGLHVQKG